MPTSFGHYYRRFFSALVKDILQLWRAQVIGVILAFLITLLQIHFGVIPRALTAKALMSVGWPYAALALFFFALSTVRTPMLLDRKREKEIEEQRESQTSEIEKSRTQIASLQGILKRDEERQSKKFSFWLEAKKSEPSREHRFKYSEHGEEKTTDAVIPFIRLLVWNEGTVPLTMSGYVCWCGEDQANPVKTIDHHWVVRPEHLPQFLRLRRKFFRPYRATRLSIGQRFKGTTRYRLPLNTKTAARPSEATLESST